MSRAAQGYRVAVVGSGSLLGKEVLAALKGRRFPITRLVEIEGAATEAALPILDLDSEGPVSFTQEALHAGDLDFIFLASRANEFPGAISAGSGRTLVIDLVGADADEGTPHSIPGLDREPLSPLEGRVVSPRALTIALSHLLLRLAPRFEIATAVAQVFSPASGIGPRAIEELQKQTVNLLSFQSIPSTVFGGQLAFNLLPRIAARKTTELTEQEEQARAQLRRSLGSSARQPALHLVQAPVFYSTAVSLYLETTATVADVQRALQGAPFRFRRSNQSPPNPVEATGSGEILVDAVAADHARRGVWIWAAFDDLRLAAENAVAIAESSITKAAGAHSTAVN